MTSCIALLSVYIVSILIGLHKPDIRRSESKMAIFFAALWWVCVFMEYRYRCCVRPMWIWNTDRLSLTLQWTPSGSKNQTAFISLLASICIIFKCLSPFKVCIWRKQCSGDEEKVSRLSLSLVYITALPSDISVQTLYGYSSLHTYSWMGRTVIDLPLREIAAFIAAPESALLYDKYIVVSHTYLRPDAINYDIVFWQDSKHLVVLSHSDTHTDTICKDTKCSTFYPWL